MLILQFVLTAAAFIASGIMYVHTSNVGTALTILTVSLGIIWGVDLDSD